MILNDDPAPIQARRSDIPDELARGAHGALARDPGKRFPDVAAMGKALRPFCAQRSP